MSETNKRVLFINDVGFQYGAGLAQLRQIQSFLLMGYDVAALCWSSGDNVESRIPFTPVEGTGNWLGITSLVYLCQESGVSSENIVNLVVCEADFLCPDLIIIGNIYGAKWPTILVSALEKLDCPVITYMHDCYWFTGRCAYTGNCTRYNIGCNHECPTWQDYPVLEPQLIFDEWLLRRKMFCGEQGMPLVTDSHWLKQEAENALLGVKKIDCIYYGLDADLFKPVKRSFARKILGIPEDTFVILSGCTNVKDFRKGGHIFQEIIHRLQDNTLFLVFGSQSENLPSVYGTGLLRDYRKMPLIYSAADIFVGTSLEEAFGQTFCEASACSIPIVAFEVGGIPEIARHRKSARLVDEQTSEALINEIEFFRQSPATRQEYGNCGRQIVETEFTLQAQGERWVQYLDTMMT